MPGTTVPASPPMRAFLSVVIFLVVLGAPPSFLGRSLFAEASNAPFGPSAGAKFLSAKPHGFGRKGVDVQTPHGVDVNGSRGVPYDLTDCNVDNCAMCAELDKDECVVCQGPLVTDSHWRTSDGQCATACSTGEIKVHTAYRGYQCVDCDETDQRECEYYCSGYRWDTATAKCYAGCQLPPLFGRNTGQGTCTAGEDLSSGTSCELECLNGATETISDGLTYACSSSDILTPPTGHCSTIWDTIFVDGEDLGERYRAIHEDWTPLACSNLTNHEVTGETYAVVDRALAALGLPNSTFFTLDCDANAVFPQNPRFTLKSADDFEVIAGKVTISDPVIYFSKDRSWDVSLFAAGSFVMPDDSSTSIDAETIALYTTSDESWIARTAAATTWTAPFGHDFLENNAVIAGYDFKDGVGNSTLAMWANCTVSLDSLEDVGEFSYIYGGASDANVAVVSLSRANIHTLTSLVVDHESLTFQPTVLRDFFITQELSLVISDTDGVFVDVNTGIVDAGLTWTTIVKPVSGSRLATALNCLGASSKYFTMHYFLDASSGGTMYFSHSYDIEMNSAWTTRDLRLTASWDSSFVLDLVATIDVALSRGEYKLPVVGAYDGTETPVLTTDVGMVNNTLGYVGVTINDVHGEFSWDDRQEICSCFFTGDLGVGAIAMRGVMHSSSPTHSFWKAIATTDGVSLGAHIVPWWNSVYPQYKVYDEDGHLADLQIDNAVITVASTSGQTVFPTSDDGSTTTTATFQSGWLLAGTQVHLETLNLGVTFAYSSTTTAASPDFEVSFDSDALDQAVDLRRSTYTADADANFGGPHTDLSSDIQKNMSIFLHYDYSDWADQSLTPVVKNIEIPTIHLPSLAGIPGANHELVVAMEVDWMETAFDFNVPLQCDSIGDDYVATFLAAIAFECIENSDCSGNEVCRHDVIDGYFNSAASNHTWHCVPECTVSEEFEVFTLGCFDIFSVGDSCQSMLPCGPNHCISGKCQVRYGNGYPCTVPRATYCESGFCCEGCGNTCQEYPLEPGFNCSTGLEFSECASDWCSSEQGVDDLEALCLSLLGDGDSCEKDKHCESEYCSVIQSDTCVTQYNVSESCYLDDDCFSGLTCCWECGFICQVYPRPVGESCFSDDDCITDFCSSASFTCSEIAADGESCAGNDGCISGYCNLDRKECYTALDDGDSCDYDSDCSSEYCSSDQGDVCFTMLADGEQCSFDSDCSSEWCTSYGPVDAATTASTNTCQSKYSAGESCSVDGQCESNDCSADCLWFSCNCA